MILKSLSILGFKSFADRVRLEFGEGITAIVGPNGSGKSNIADAIQWVLGEQSVRALRAESSTEVIFAGSMHRKPLGMAEVSLTIDNSDGLLPIDFAEVTVTRRLYRSGESEYLINKTPCRLKDIVELFMDTGLGRASYAILTQNEVDIALSTKPEERRALFEEAAGIQKYRHRKREALRKLENTEQNLLRVQDILAELESQREPLRQQAEVAIRYQQLNSRLRDIESASLWAQVIESEQAREQTVLQQQRLHRELLQVHATLAECEALSQKLGAEIVEAEAELDTLRALQQSALTAYERTESRKALIEQRLQNHRANFSNLQQELAEDERQLTILQEQTQQWQQRRLELQKRLEEAEQQYQSARERLHLAESTLQQAQQYHLERTQEVIRARAHMENLRDRRSETEQSVQAFIQQMETAEQALLAAQQAYASARNRHSEGLAQLEQAQQQVKQQEQALQQAQQHVEQQQKLLEQRARENARLSARLQTLIESEAAQEGLYGGVRAVMEAVTQGHLQGVYILVADALRPQEAYVTAIEVALGASAQDIITATEEEARRAIEWLKQHSRGRATFLPLQLLRPAEAPKDLQGCVREGLSIAFGCDLVDYPPELEKAARYLLGRVLVAPDFDSALQIVRCYSGWSKVVTVDGELFLPGGAVTGGRLPGRATGIVSRKAERLRVEKAIEEGEREEKHLRRKLQEALQEYQQVQQQSRATAQRLTQAQLQLAHAETQLRTALHQQETLQQQVQNLQQQHTEQVQRLYQLDTEIINLQQRLPALATDEPLPAEEVVRYRQQRDEAMAQVQSTEVLKGRLSEQLRAMEREREVLAQRQRELLQQVENRKARLADIEAQIAQDEQALQSTLQELQRIALQHEQVERDFAKQRVVRQELLQQSFENSERLKELSLQQQRLAQQSHELDLKLARIEMQRTQAVTRLWEEYEIDVAHQSPPESVQYTPEIASEIQRLRREIRQMGNVNTGAAEEYQRLTERYEFLAKQREDLESARADILQAIREIDASTRHLFLETFHAVQQAFNNLFVRLFEGGKAELQLTQPDNILETGIEIAVQLPGKRRQNLLLLSGGERALVAIALMFAFLEVKPSPFCVLDEVDAALDGVNVEKFVELLQHYARHSQVLIITHNPVTMECADVWYGVTMQEQGISRVISYRATHSSNHPPLASAQNA